MVLDLLHNIWAVFLDMAFWLLLGLLAAGFIKSYISQSTMTRWVGGRGLSSIIRAALFGAPLPLCSCGVLPAAIGLHRSGASKEATVSFLISTPETSVDSVAVTYALMGPVMAIVRPVAALVNAVGTGLLTSLVREPGPVPAQEQAAEHNCCATSAVKSACCSEQATGETSCCAGTGKELDAGEDAESMSSCCSGHEPPRGKVMQALSYAGAELLDDISKWLAFGIVLAGIMLTFIPPNWLAQWGGGLTAMLIMLVVGVPMYICAVASTPVAAGLLLAGVSPGAVLVFLLVGPATNIASFALLRRELGLKVTAIYLFGLSVISLVMGLAFEWLLASQQWSIEAKIGHAHSVLPDVITWLSAVLLLVLGIRPLRRNLFPRLG